MYPDADIPVLQISMPSLEPERLLRIGQALRPLRDEGVLIVGSGFLTHGLPFLRDFRFDAPELPRVFRTGNLRLIHAASCPFRYSSRTSCGVRYPSVEWRRVLL
jgi:aromatic ring-opening dioxygenase catalytic subunit (LigB family)